MRNRDLKIKKREVSNPDPLKDAERALFRKISMNSLFLEQLFLGTDNGAKPLGQQSSVKRFYPGFVDTRAIKVHQTAIIGQQGDQDHVGELGIAAQVQTDLQRFGPADKKIHDDAVRMEAFCLDPGVKTARSQCYPK